MPKERARKKFTFSDELKNERRRGVGHCCEQCGRNVKDLEVHHLYGAWLAAQNPVMTPEIIRVLENEMCLCPECHVEANRDQETWTAHDLGMLAWALFDLDPAEVEANQIQVYGPRRHPKNRRQNHHRRGARRQKKRAHQLRGRDYRVEWAGVGMGED